MVNYRFILVGFVLVISLLFCIEFVVLFVLVLCLVSCQCFLIVHS